MRLRRAARALVASSCRRLVGEGRLSRPPARLLFGRPRVDRPGLCCPVARLRQPRPRSLGVGFLLLAVALGSLHFGQASRRHLARAGHPPSALLSASPLAARVNSAEKAPGLRVVAITPWTGPHGVFRATLAVTGTQPLSDFDVALAVYPALPDRSAFALSRQNRELAAPLTEATWPASALSSGRLVRLGIAVGSTPPDTHSLALGLSGSCPATCQGVYPVLVQLVSPSGRIDAEATLHLVVAEPAVRRLQVTWLLPLAAPVVAGADGKLRPAPGTPTGLVEEVADLPGLPAAPTLVPDPATLLALGADPSSLTATALGSLRTWSGVPGHALVARSLLPASLLRGLDPAVARRLAVGEDRLGQQVLASVLGVAGSESTAVFFTAPSRDDLADLPPTTSSLIVPNASLERPSTPLTPASPVWVRLPSGRRVEAIGIDPGLLRDASSAPGDPVLAADNVLADLAQTYFEEPYDPRPRGIVLAVPAGESTSAVFVSTLAEGLAASPILSTVTPAQLVRAVPPRSSSVVGLAAGTGRALPSRTRADLRTVEALASAGAPGRVLRTLLALTAASCQPAESPTNRRVIAASFRGQMTAIMNAITVSGSGRVTLTAPTTTLPITLVSSDPWPMRVVVRATSPGLSFPAGARRTLRLAPGKATVVDLPVRVRSSGVFPVELTVTTPTGNLTLTSRRLSVRSVAVSIVGLLLTGLAIVTLGAWWLRSSRRRPQSRPDPTESPLGPAGSARTTAPSGAREIGPAPRLSGPA